jgi:hypothetical protein
MLHILHDDFEERVFYVGVLKRQQDSEKFCPMRREQMSDDVRLILQKVVARQCLEQKDTADHSTIYRSYWAQWKSLAVKHGIIKWHWEVTNRWN